MPVLINLLTETQILQEIRKRFEHQAMTGIDVDKLINTCKTLEELFASIQQEIDVRNSKSLS